MFVHWIENGDTSRLNQTWVTQKRNEIASAYLEGQTIEPQHLSAIRTKYLNRAAIVTSGLWARNDIVVGGPFKNYTFLRGNLMGIGLREAFP